MSGSELSCQTDQQLMVTVSDNITAATILIVEDYAGARLMMRQALERRGFRVVEAVNGWEAIGVAARENPDLVLMDLHMPVLDGFEATCLMREHPQLKDVPIVAVSAYDSPDDLADAADVGMTDYVSKPVDLNRLYSLITRLLPVFST